MYHLTRRDGDGGREGKKIAGESAHNRISCALKWKYDTTIIFRGKKSRRDEHEVKTNTRGVFSGSKHPSAVIDTSFQKDNVQWALRVSEKTLRCSARFMVCAIFIYIHAELISYTLPKQCTNCYYKKIVYSLVIHGTNFSLSSSFLFQCLFGRKFEY